MIFNLSDSDSPLSSKSCSVHHHLLASSPASADTVGVALLSLSELLLIDIIGGFLGWLLINRRCQMGRLDYYHHVCATRLLFINGGFSCHWPARFHTPAFFVCLSQPPVLNIFDFWFSPLLFSSLTRIVLCCLKDGSFPAPLFLKGRKVQFHGCSCVVPQLNTVSTQSRLPAACNAHSLCIAACVPDLDSCLIPALPLCQRQGTCPALRG